ncbi:hypothetical protein LguiA_009311 [Lonicera macranthoides]
MCSVSGFCCWRKNHDGRLGDEKADLLDYTWKLFGAGKQLQLVDERLSTNNPDEAAKCIRLGPGKPGFQDEFDLYSAKLSSPERRTWFCCG